MTEGLVSLLTPCYNGGKFIHRLLDSVLIQDYPHIEMIVVDDGSTDDTQQKVEEYIPKFTQRGYSLNYLHKENGGQASAINMGLPLLRGEFIAWPDSDDFYTYPHSVSTFVNALKEGGDKVGLARSIGKFIDASSMKPSLWSSSLTYAPVEKSFIAMIKDGNFLMVPINYMAKATAIDASIPERQIYQGRHPQNIQMFDPLTYCFKVVDTEPGLTTIVVRDNSHSHSPRTFEQLLDDFDGFMDIHEHTFDNMPYLSTHEREKYKKIVAKMQLNEKLSICFHQLDKNMAHNVAKEMKRKKVSMHWKKRIKYAMLMTCPKLLEKIRQA